jgi:uncharacterized membrane protein YfcA
LSAADGLLHTPLFWVFGIASVVMLGLGKGGFIGFGTLATPLLALAVPPVQAAAILLPLLIVQDAVGVWSFRASWDARILKLMLPGSLLGIAIGYVFAAALPQHWVLAMLGAISVGFGLQRLWMERGGRAVAPQLLPDWAGFLCGAGSGLSSQIAHAGGPPFQLYVLPRRLPRDVMVGTTTIFFAVTNWAKVPAYAALGEFDRANLIAAAALLPVATASTFAGVWLVRRVPAERFYTIIYVLTVLVGTKLLWDAWHQIVG